MIQSIQFETTLQDEIGCITMMHRDLHDTLRFAPANGLLIDAEFCRALSRVPDYSQLITLHAVPYWTAIISFFRHQLKVMHDLQLKSKYGVVGVVGATRTRSGPQPLRLSSPCLDPDGLCTTSRCVAFLLSNRFFLERHRLVFAIVGHQKFPCFRPAY